MKDISNNTRVFFNEKMATVVGDMHIENGLTLKVIRGVVEVPVEKLEQVAAVLARDGWTEKAASEVIASGVIQTPREFRFERPGANPLNRLSGAQIHVGGSPLTIKDDCVTVDAENRELIASLEKAGFKNVQVIFEERTPEPEKDDGDASEGALEQ